MDTGCPSWSHYVQAMWPRTNLHVLEILPFQLQSEDSHIPFKEVSLGSLDDIWRSLSQERPSTENGHCHCHRCHCLHRFTGWTYSMEAAATWHHTVMEHKWALEAPPTSMVLFHGRNCGGNQIGCVGMRESHRREGHTLEIMILPLKGKIRSNEKAKIQI